MVIKVITFELSGAQNIRKRKRELSLILLMTKSCSMFNGIPKKKKKKKSLLQEVSLLNFVWSWHDWATCSDFAEN